MRQHVVTLASGVVSFLFKGFVRLVVSECDVSL